MADGAELAYTPDQAPAVTAVARGRSYQEVKFSGKKIKGDRMRIAEVFTSGYYGGDGCVCEDNFNYGNASDYGYENRNRRLGDDRAGDFNDRDTPVPMFRGNRAGPIS